MMLRISLAAALAVAGLATSTFGAAVTVSTVGTYAPNPNNLTIRDAASNSLTNGITLSAFQTQVSSAFANNTGGVWNGDDTSGISYGVNYGENAANAITAQFGSLQANSLNFYRTDGVVGQTGFSNVNNGTQTVSGTGAIGFSFDSAPSIEFNQGLSALGLSLVPRPDGQARSATLVAVLDDATTLTSSTEGVTSSDPVFFGFTAPAGRTIVGLNITPGGGFARFDDLGFVVANAAPVPEPASLGLVGLGGLAMLRRRRA